MSQFLVDTNIWSETMRKAPNADVVNWMRENERQLFMSAITVGEIKSGIEGLPSGQRKRRYQEWLSGLTGRMEGRVLSFNTTVATVWGQMVAGALKKGITLSAVDSQIAATAKRHSLIIATRNQRDFAHADVKIVNPFEV